MKKIRFAFTMIELVFVIVVLGILAAVAIPRFSGYIEDANTARAKSLVSALRTAIMNERQKNIMKGVSSYPQLLDDAGTGDDEELFDGNGTIHILQYPIYSGSNAGEWKKTTNNSGTTIKYNYKIRTGETVTFTYTKETGTFDCNHSLENCRSIAE